MTFDNEPTAPAPTAPVPTTAPVPPTTAPANPVVMPKRRSNQLLDLALLGAAVIAIGGVAFAIGRGTAPAAAAGAFTRGGPDPGGVVIGPDGSFEPGTGPKGQGGALAQAGGLAIDGTVTAVDADSITLKLADGQEMTFKLDNSTNYREATDATPSDVAVGDDVSVTASGNGRAPAAGSSGEAPGLSARDVTVTR
jgi:uncharacterized protein DUF5666